MYLHSHFKQVNKDLFDPMFGPMHPSAFFRHFLLNLEAYTELQTKPFI